jgi:hypothetical protein
MPTVRSNALRYQSMLATPLLRALLTSRHFAVVVLNDA